MKTIGLIGGMSWESSLVYYRFINEGVKDRLGGLHSAQCIMYSVDFAKIEPLQRDGKWAHAAQKMLATIIALLAITAGKAAEVFQIDLENPSFTNGVDNGGVPLGWSKYGGGGTDQELKIVAGPDGGKALLIADGDPSAEIGVSQTFHLSGDKTYQVTAKVRAAEGVSTMGAYLQFRFLPSNRLVRTGLAAKSVDAFSEVRLVGGVPPPPPPPPAPVPPQYDKLKNLHLDIALVKDGQPNAVIVAPASGIYKTAAEAVQRAIEDRTGVKAPILSDDRPEAAVPIPGNLIVLGNRSTNRTIGALYDLYYCLVDLKYLTGDGRWITYRKRTEVDTDAFRLGQSFWPDETLKPELPVDLVGNWSIHRLPRPAWNARGSGLPLEKSFYFGSYRSTADATGDYILLDGFNGASRNPYHTFDVLQLRLDGHRSCGVITIRCSVAPMGWSSLPWPWTPP